MIEAISSTPAEKWKNITERLSRLEDYGHDIDRSMMLVSDLEPRKMDWLDLVEKILAMQEVVTMNRNLGINPDEEVYDDLKEAEEEIEKFKI